MKRYNTEQRKILLSFLQSHADRQFLIEQIADELCANENISASSVYRNINDMIEDGLVARFPSRGEQRFVYQYLGDEHCKTHIHMKCDGCGQLIHLEDDVMQQLLNSIKNSEAFTVDIQRTILYGTCRQCEKETRA